MIVGRFKLTSFHNGRFVLEWNEDGKIKRKMVPNLEEKLDKWIFVEESKLKQNE